MLTVTGLVGVAEAAFGVRRSQMELRNKKWSEDQFYEVLAEVRSWWPTGQEVDLEGAVEYHKRMPEGMNLAKIQRKAEAEGRVLIGPKLGAATVEQTLELALYARDEGEPDIMGIQADTYTRRNQFKEAVVALAGHY